MSNDQKYVWVVHYDNYGDRWLVGVFDDESLVSKFKPQDPESPWKCDYEITKTRLNPARTMADEPNDPPPQTSYTCYRDNRGCQVT